MNKTILEITEKYLSLMDREETRLVLERVYLWAYNRIPEAYYIWGDTMVSESLTFMTEDFKQPNSRLKYKPRDLFNSLKESEGYVDYLRTPYSPGRDKCSETVIIMEDAIIRIDTVLLPNLSEYGSDMTVYTDSPEVAEKYKKMINWVSEEKPETFLFSYLFQNSIGKLKEKRMEIKRFEIDIEKNYNSDLPLERIEDFLESPSSGLIIFNGEPGTGKTSLLKYLMMSHPAKEWVMIPSKVISGCGEEALVDYFIEGKNKIYVLEDCEKLILRREKGNNLETFLNLTDGLLGDAVCPKFICTFNTPLSNIDPALLRKGRLKLRYEFGPLSLEKTKVHIPEATSPMTLADIYNLPENGGLQVRKKIGY